MKPRTEVRCLVMGGAVNRALTRGKFNSRRNSYLTENCREKRGMETLENFSNAWGGGDVT